MAKTNHSLGALTIILVAMGLVCSSCDVVQEENPGTNQTPSPATTTRTVPEKTGLKALPGDPGRIAYAAANPSATDKYNYDIYTIDATGGKPFQLTNNNTDDRDPTYSPDGKKIAYVGEDDEYNYDIYTIDATGGKPFKVTDNNKADVTPSWGGR